jgi:hypothetical protein
VSADRTPDDILADIAELASTHDWPQVTGFLDSVRPEVAVFAAESADSTGFTRWLGPAVSVRDQAELVADPTVVLTAQRSVLLIRAGEVILADTLAAAMAVRSLPAGAGLVVLLHAENMTSEELDDAQRRAWRALVDSSGERWVQQDLADHDILFWADKPARSPTVDRDTTLTSEWFAREPTGLSTARAYHALELAEHACDRRTHDPIDPAKLAEAVAVKQKQLTSRLSQDFERLRARCTTAVRGFEPRLTRAVLAAIDRDPDKPPGDAIAAVVRSSAEDWTKSFNQLAGEQLASTVQDARDQLADIDWAALNELLGTQVYPGTLLDAYGTAAQVDSSTSPGRLPAAAAAGSKSDSSMLRVLVVGAAAGRAAAIVAGPVVSGAVGLATGLLVDHVLVGLARNDRRKERQSHVASLVSGVAADLDDHVAAQITQRGAETRQAVDREFDHLRHELATAAPGETAVPGRARLRALRAELTTK